MYTTTSILLTVIIEQNCQAVVRLESSMNSAECFSACSIEGTILRLVNPKYHL